MLSTTYSGEPKKVDTPAHRKRFAQPDNWQKPSAEIKRLVPAFQKISGARAMAAYLTPNENLSISLQTFVRGVRRVATELGHVER